MALSHSPSIVTNGLVLNLDAANPRSYPRTGINWFDVSGNGNHGVLTNGPTYNPANGGAINFDGVNDLVSANAPPVTYPFTICAWMQSSNMQNTRLMRLGNDVNGNNQFMSGFVFDGLNWRANAAIYVGGTPLFTMEVGLFGAGIGAFSTAYMYQVVVWRSTSNRQIYVNGVSAGLNTTSVASIPTFTKYYVGGHPNDGSRYLKGFLASTSIYNRDLTPAEILQNYNALRGRFGV